MNSLELTDIKSLLENNNIRVSHQRIQILKYLMNSKEHPTVETIYTFLKPMIPSLSKMTVYNTLNSFIDAGIVKLITIEGYETRYDADVSMHAHFKCRECGCVTDIAIEKLIQPEVLQKTHVTDIDVFLRGTCPECQAKENN